MLDIRRVVENLDQLKEVMRRRHAELNFQEVATLDQRRRSLLHQVETLKHQKNTASEEIGRRKKNKEDAEALITEMKAAGQQISDMEKSLREVEDALDALMLTIPNIPHESVPVGEDEKANKVVRTWGEPLKFAFEPKDHVTLGEGLDIIDLERGAKVTGARFAFMKGAGARMERALQNYFLDLHTREFGYTEILPPFLVNRDSAQGTGQLPKFKADLFCTAEEFYLIPTAEVPVTNYHRDEILEEEALPLKYAAFSPCFRSEAGSYGRDTRGLIRMHQFQKVELVKFSRPEESYDELEKLVENAEEALRRLGLPYRVVLLCDGDMGFGAAKCYDLEVWLPSQNTYREISSCSNFEDFQARRAKIRYRPKDGKKPHLLHTLNGSGLAIGRTLVAILENYQDTDGSVHIPPVLVPYMDGMTKISGR